MAYFDLEISLGPGVEAGQYTVELRGRRPDSAAGVRAGGGTARFDFAALQRLEANPAQYGQTLSQALFADQPVSEAFAAARASAEGQNLPLRLRLLVGPGAERLHALRWETLADPRGGPSLAANANLPFSRYLGSPDWRPVQLRGRSQMRALLAVSSPADLDTYSLAPVDVPGELERARAALRRMQVTALPAAGRRVTLENIFAHLREQPCDLLYLVCHGAWVQEDTWLWLEDGDGNTARVSGSELAARLQGLTQRPALVVLASCETADARAEGSLSALAPRLVAAGIPAVLAMQARIGLETLSALMAVFFDELQRHGQIDQALASARAAAGGSPASGGRPDAWMPALFTRLEDGCIWAQPGFRGEHGEKVEFKKWPSLLQDIQDGRCTPILGPGLYEALLGSPRSLARRWAEEHGYPLAPYERESLPQVAQYLTVSQGPAFPYRNLGEILRDELRRRFSGQLPAGPAPLDELLAQAAALLRSQDGSDPYTALAELPLPIYLSATTDTLLGRALAQAGQPGGGKKEPQPVLCRWNEYTERLRNIYSSDPGYYPTPERPLVYHFFGRLGEVDSLVLTEDDYFDFLIGVTNNQQYLPSDVRRALTDTSLLFLGFQMDDWGFRTLLRFIRSLQGGRRRERDDRVHVSVQIEPEASRTQDPSGAFSYLKEYFYQAAEISVYWGSSQDFIRELKQRWDEHIRERAL